MIIERIKEHKKKSLCNDNVHYNSWDNFVLNNNDIIDNKTKTKALDDLFATIQIALCEHFSYIYILHPEYYSSTDYVEALDSGVEPELNSQYWVCPVIQDIFDKYIKTYNKDLSKFILDCKTINFE